MRYAAPSVAERARQWGTRGLLATVGGLMCTYLTLVTVPAGAEQVVEGSAMSQQDARPQTIPALRSWLAQSGTFMFLPTASRIVVASENWAALSETADVFATDLAHLRGVPFPVANEADTPVHAGDILLRLRAAEADLGQEGYQLDINESIDISATTAVGVFYGTRTLLQLLSQRDSLQFGSARDWPLYRERGMMVDIARRYFPLPWFEHRIREMAYLKMNYLHLHISDNEGFGIESEYVVRAAGEEKNYLSKAELICLVRFARKYNVKVVPEIDMPGHMRALLSGRPQFGLPNVFGARSDKVLDVTNDAAVQFAFDVVKEFIDMFPGDYWHTGADEVLSAAAYALYPALARSLNNADDGNANNKDAIHHFVNKVNGLVRAHEKQTRAWGDDLGGGATEVVDKNIVVEWWTDVAPLSDWHTPTPQALLLEGHEIMNCGWWPTYLVPGRFPLPPRPNIADAYEGWNVNEFYGIVYLSSALRRPPQLVALGDQRLRGAKLNIWNDQPKAESIEELTADISERLRVLAQKTWSSPPLSSSYEQFLSVADVVGNAPGNRPASDR